jgi:FkbM family methyltransferase
MDQSGVELKGYRREHGLLWPDYDIRCADVTFWETEENISLIRARCGRRRTAIQAGGNCGQLVREMAGLFGAVYTFEPNLENFVALTVNTAGLQNVFRIQAGLSNAGSRGQLSGMGNGDDKFPDTNCGALYLSGPGKIPLLTIDDLGLYDVDLVMLDIEGAEFPALQGAGKTIECSRPVVIFEEKRLGEKFFGHSARAAENYLRDAHGYRVLERRKIDTVMGPA